MSPQSPILWVVAVKMAIFVKSNKIERFLDSTLYKRGKFRLDYWALVHLAWGFLLGYLITNFIFIQGIYASLGFNLINFQMVFFILVAYEVLEWIDINYSKLFFEKSEKIGNIVQDIVIGMIGYGAFTLI